MLDAQLVRYGFHLLESTPSLPPRDAVHAGTVLTHGITAIVSADPHFDDLTQVVQQTISRCGR